MYHMSSRSDMANCYMRVNLLTYLSTYHAPTPTNNANPCLRRMGVKSQYWGRWGLGPGQPNILLRGHTRCRVSNNVTVKKKQEFQLSPSDRAMRLVGSNLANYHATVQTLLIRQVLTKPMA